MGVDPRTLGSYPELKAAAELAQHSEPLRHSDSFFFPVLRTLLCVETAAVCVLMGEVARSGTPLQPSSVFHSLSRHSESSTHTEAWLKGLPCGRLWLPKEGRKEIVRQEWVCGKERMAPALPMRRWPRAWGPAGACPQGRTAHGVSLPTSAQLMCTREVSWPPKCPAVLPGIPSPSQLAVLAHFLGVTLFPEHPVSL